MTTPTNQNADLDLPKRAGVGKIGLLADEVSASGRGHDCDNYPTGKETIGCRNGMEKTMPGGDRGGRGQAVRELNDEEQAARPRTLEQRSEDAGHDSHRSI